MNDGCQQDGLDTSAASTSRHPARRNWAMLADLQLGTTLLDTLRTLMQRHVAVSSLHSAFSQGANVLNPGDGVRPVRRRASASVECFKSYLGTGDDIMNMVIVTNACAIGLGAPSAMPPRPQTRTFAEGERRPPKTPDFSQGNERCEAPLRRLLVPSIDRASSWWQ